MSDALLLLARDDGAEASRSHTPPWNTSVQDVGGASSLWEEWRIRELRAASVIGGSSRSGNRNDGEGKELLEGENIHELNTEIPVDVELHNKHEDQFTAKKLTLNNCMYD